MTRLPILSSLIFVLLLNGCATTSMQDVVSGNWTYNADISKKQAQILSENISTRQGTNQVTNNAEFDVTIEGEQLFGEDGTFTHQSEVQLNVFILLGTIHLTFRLKEEGTWSIAGKTLTMVAEKSEVQPTNEVTTIFATVNPYVTDAIKSPKDGREATIISADKKRMELEFDPQAKVQVILTRK